MRSSSLKVVCSLVILLSITGSVMVVSRSQETIEVHTTEIIRSPLSTMPAPVLVGRQFTVTVAVAQSAALWALAIESRYDVYSLDVSPLGYDPSEEVWRVNATVSTNVQPGLYTVKLSVVVDGKNNTYTQPRSVWVMSQSPEEFRIAHLTDVHYALNPDHLRQAIAQLNFLRPTLAIITGDIADIGSSEREVQGFWTALQDADFPTYCVPGNHDYKNRGESIYMKYEGPLNYSVDMGFAYFIALDTGHERSYVDAEQLEWAARILSTVPASKFKIIGFHHPLFAFWTTSSAMNITGSWESIQDLRHRIYYSWNETEQALEAATELLRMVQEHNVNLVLQGHIHRDVIFIVNQENHFVVTSPLGGPPVPGMPYSYRMVTVKNGRITGLTYPDRPLSSFMGASPHSVPVQLLEVSYGPQNTGLTAAVTAVLRNNRGDPVRGPLEMALSKEHRIDEYATFPEAVPYSVVVGPSAYYFRFNVSLPPGEGLRLTVATGPDPTPPTIGPPEATIFPLGSKYSVKLQPEITDMGWGVENATLLYLLETATEWEEVAMTRGAGNSFEARISGIPINETVSYRIVAYDYAGHKAETERQIISSQETTTSVTETTPIETSTTTTVTATTTTETSPVTPSTPATTETSTSPTTTTPSTTTQTTTAPPTTTVTLPPTPSTTEGPPAATTTMLIVAVVVVVIVVLAAALLIRRKSSQPGKP